MRRINHEEAIKLIEEGKRIFKAATEWLRNSGYGEIDEEKSVQLECKRLGIDTDTFYLLVGIGSPKNIFNLLTGEGRLEEGPIEDKIAFEIHEIVEREEIFKMLGEMRRIDEIPEEVFKKAHEIAKYWEEKFLSSDC